VFVVILCGCSNPAGKTVADDEHAALTAAVDTIAATALAEGPIVGLSIAVALADDVVVDKGYGFADLERGIRATVDTSYDIASVTKLFTAIAVMRLVEDGKLRLDDDVSALLPAFPNRRQGRNITIRHLLSHTSGLRDYEEADTRRWLEEGTPLTQDFVLNHVKDRSLLFDPGSRWSYSNTGFYLLALIIEQVTGERYADYVLEQVAVPLALTGTFPCDGAARGYETSGNVPVPSRLFALHGIVGDGGLCSTATDLVRLPRALRRGDVLRAAALAEMTRSTVLTSGVAVDYGLGVRRGSLEGQRLWGHTGGMRTYWAVLAHYPDAELTIVVLVNTDGTGDDALTIEARVARAALGLGAPVLKDLPLRPHDIATFSGVYEDGSGAIRVIGEGRRLRRVINGSGGTPQNLLYQGDDTFGRTDYPMDRFVFHVAHDRVIGLSEYYNGIFATFRSNAAPDHGSTTMAPRSPDDR